MAVSDSAKLGRGVFKPLLLAALQDLLPADMGTSPKQGFTLPFETWMRKELHAEVDQFFASGKSASVGINGHAAKDAWAEFLCADRGMSWGRPWSLYTLVRWVELNRVELPS
jgi:hypothetical protein